MVERNMLCIDVEICLITCLYSKLIYERPILNLLKLFLSLKNLILSFKNILESSDFDISTIYMNSFSAVV